MEMLRQDQVDCIRALENSGFITAAQARDALTRPGGEAALDSRINELRECIYPQTKPTGPVFDKNMTEQDAESLRLEMQRQMAVAANMKPATPPTTLRESMGPPRLLSESVASLAAHRASAKAAVKTEPVVSQRIHNEVINAQNEAIGLLRDKVERMELAGKAWELDLAYMVDHARSVLNQRYNDSPAEATPAAVVSSLCDEVRRLRGIIADMGARGGKRGAVVCCQNDEEDA